MGWWPFSRKHDETKERVEPDFRASLEDPNTPINADQLAFITGGGPTMAGPLVSEATAIRCVDVYRCVSILSGLVASLRMNVYRTINDKRDLAETHRLYPLLRVEPNENMSAFTWRELMMVNLLLWGNHYTRIEYDNSSRIVGFYPLAPWTVKPERLSDGALRYRVETRTGAEVYPADDILHVPGLGFDGVCGLSAIQYVGRQAIGTSLAMEEFTARLHSNGVRPSGIGKVKEGISPAAFSRMKSQFEQHYAGVGNAGTTLWVDAGTEWQQMQLSPADAETLNSRRYSTAQICNIFGVPAMLLNENADMTAWGSGIEQIMLGFLMTTINTWLRRIEDEFNRKLFLGTNLSVEFDREGLIVLDSKAKAELFSKLINSAMMTPNEGRRRMNLPDMPHGDGLYIQSGTVPLEVAGQQGGAQLSSPPPAATTQGRRDRRGLDARFHANMFGQQIGVLTEPIARAFDLEDDGVMEETVEQRRGDDRVSEDLAPFCKAAVKAKADCMAAK